MTLDELRALCDAATPGRWRFDEDNRCEPAVKVFTTAKDALFIATFNPVLVAKLLAVAEAAQAAVANDLEWEQFDYKTADHMPEDDRVHTRRMQAALDDVEAP